MGGFDSKDSEAENRKHAMGMGQVFFNAVKTMLDEVETYTVAATSRKVGVQYSLAFMMADNYLDTVCVFMRLSLPVHRQILIYLFTYLLIHSHTHLLSLSLVLLSPTHNI
jgi:hypothetical protein